MGVVSATLGAAVIGGVMQSNAQKKANKANLAQQAAALAFQEKNFQIAENYLKQSKQDSFRTGSRLAAKAVGDAKAQMIDRGIDPTGSIGLGYRRGMYRDAMDAAQELEFKYGQSLAAVRSGAEFPMIMQEAPQGMAGDFAKAVSGAYMAHAMGANTPGTTAAMVGNNLTSTTSQNGYQFT